METILYQKMYALLCGAVSDALDLLEDGNAFAAMTLLRAALTQAEELYIGGE